MGTLNIWSEIRLQGWTITTAEQRHRHSLSNLKTLLPLSMLELWTVWSYSYCIKQKEKMLFIIIFFVHLLCILALPCIINEFYILIDKVKSNEFLKYTPRAFRGDVSLTFEVCACMCVWGTRPWKLSVSVTILNWTMLNCSAWKRMYGQAKGEYCNHVNIYLSKQNVNILFYILYQGLLFQCKCEPIICILLSCKHPLNLCLALSTSGFNLI